MSDGDYPQRLPSTGGKSHNSRMSPEDLRRLRRRLCLTQVQFADRSGVSPALIASLECGRRRITERRVREIARLFGDDLYGELTGSTPVRAVEPASGPVLPPISASAPKFVSKPVQVAQPATAPVSNPASVPRPAPVVTWSTCAWRDPGVGLCGGLTPQGMLYCAQHMALAMIEGRPTRHG
jgi:transcriptional regulator with XRE-family HTH domain